MVIVTKILCNAIFPIAQIYNLCPKREKQNSPNFIHSSPSGHELKARASCLVLKKVYSFIVNPKIDLQLIFSPDIGLQ